MATVRWRGDAPAVAQVQSYVLGGTWEVGDIINCVIGTKTFSYTTTSTSASTIATGLVAAWNALSGVTYPEFAELTASNSTNTFKLTADTAGKPFTVTLSTTETGGGAADAQTIDGATSSTGTATTASAGPNDWGTAANWSGGAIPANSDNVYIEDSDVDILYGLDQNGVTPTSLNIAQNYTGKIGLPYTNSDSASGSYIEYRERYLKIGAATVNIGRGEGPGSQRMNLNLGTTNATVNVFNTGPAESGREAALLLIDTNSSSVLNLERGSVGVALEAGNTSEFATIRVGYVDNKASDSDLRTGSGVTLATLTMAGGTVTIGHAVTAITQDDGTLTIEGTGAVTTLVVNGGTCYYNTTGTLGTPTVSGTGILDFSQDLRTKSVTNAVEVFGSNCKVRDPHKVVGTLVIDSNYNADLSGFEIGTNVRLTRGTPS